MKKLLLLVLSLTSASAFAQNVEVALGGGVSINSQPTDNMVYKGEKITFNYAANLGFVYNFSDDWQVGLHGTVLQLSRASDKIYTGPDGSPIGGSNKVFVYSDEDASVYLTFNRKQNVGNGYIYGGLAAGFGIARDDSKSMTGSQVYKGPDGGNGFAGGAQLGYVVGINSRFGAYAEAAVRYFDLKYDAEAPDVHPHTALHYQIMAFPVTVGIRFRFINSRVQNNIPAFRGRGRSR